MVIVASLLSLALLVPSLYMSYDEELDFADIENLIAIAYPLADAIVMIPALIGVTLFFKGEVNFLWALMCLAFFCDIIADSGFLFTTLDDSYYTGHPIDILFMWSYILFSFGIYDHIKVFKTQKKQVDI